MPRRPSPCYNCGTPDAQTRDHVFPRSLFTAPRPNPSPTVPACGRCQRRTRPDEDYFRDIVAGGAYVHPTARALWDGPILRSFKRRPKNRSTLADALRTVQFRSKAGLFLGSVVGIEGDQERIGIVLPKIVRGLFYVDAQRPMPTDVSWSFEQLSPLNPEPPPAIALELIQSMPLRTVGTEVRYKFGRAPEDHRLSLAWMSFYDRTMFLVGTLPDGATPCSATRPAGASDSQHD